jgi:3-dehydroquinate synthase
MQLCEYTQILTEVQSSQFIIIDKALISLYPELNSKLFDKNVYYIDGPEISKNISIFEECCEFFITKHISRSDYILVIGGGATSDLGGFVAATILRGIKWKVVPTTLLAMIDASIGGKVGVNSRSGKNLIGNFCEPNSILICDTFLDSLSKLELDSGKGELIKYAFLNKDIYNVIISNGFTKEVIYKCALYKQEIVDQDLNESGIRKLLNLGHTFGHVFERMLNLPHGVAVNLGIEFILQHFNEKCLDDLKKIRKSLDIKIVEFKKVDFYDFWSQVLFDKKICSGHTVDLIVIKNIGECVAENIKLEELKYKIKKSGKYENFFC